MLRFLFRRPRTVRVPIDRSNVEVQQVNLTKQSRPVVARFILTCMVTTVLIQSIKYWDPLGTYARRDVLQDELERVKKDAQNGRGDKYGKHWDKQHARMKSSQATGLTPEALNPGTIRVTVPVWLRKGHQRVYNENDPEFKEFAKLQGDPKRIDQIKRQIGESVMHGVKGHGSHQFELAVIQFNGRAAVALEIVPQLYTPPVYEVPCIWISPSFTITTGWRPLPHQTGLRMERVFRPVVLLEASTAAMQTFFYITYAVTKARIMEAMGRQSSMGHKSTIVLPQVPKPKSTTSDPNTDISKSSKPIFPLFPDLGNGEAMRKMHADIVSSMPYSTAIQHAAFAFNHTKNVRQLLASSTNVRGMCQIRGYITFFGERGKLRVEVLAYYLPAENVFLGAVNVKSGYVVQDYQAWGKMIDKEKQQKQKQKESDAANRQAKTVSSPEESKPSETPSAPSQDQGEEKNN